MTDTTPDPEPMLDVAAILARADAATPGPWVVSFPEIHSLGLGGHPTEVVWQMPFEGGGVEREADATFIAAARTDVPGLVDALRVRDAELAALRAERDALAKRVEELETPDSLMPPHSECAYPADDLVALADDMQVPIGEYRRVLAFKTLPDRWLAHVVVTRDDDGDPDDTELRLFATQADAEAAIAGREGEG